MNIGTKTHELDEMGIQRGDHKAGARNGDDQIDFVRTEIRALQALFRGFTPKLYGMLDVFVVCLAQRAGLDSILNRKDGVALVYLRVVHDRHHCFQTPLGDVKNPTHVIFHVIARNAVGR
jgi:hypothetical protein